MIYGKPAKGRLLFMGGMAHATIALSSEWEMPEYNILKTPSWQELNKGKKSKRQRRG